MKNLEIVDLTTYTKEKEDLGDVSEYMEFLVYRPIEPYGGKCCCSQCSDRCSDRPGEGCATCRNGCGASCSGNCNGATEIENNLYERQIELKELIERS